MKRFVSQFFILLAILSLTTGCGRNSKGSNNLSENIQFEMSGPDGNMKLTAIYHPFPSDVTGCFGVFAHTEGDDVFSNIWLDFYAKDDIKVGDVLRFEYIMFSAPLSSDSSDYTYYFSGKMILKEKTKEKVVIRMKNVCFGIHHGEYRLNGDLVATAE